jgi:hypothetical protein
MRSRRAASSSGVLDLAQHARQVHRARLALVAAGQGHVRHQQAAGVQRPDLGAVLRGQQRRAWRPKKVRRLSTSRISMRGAWLLPRHPPPAAGR